MEIVAFIGSLVSLSAAIISLIVSIKDYNKKEGQRSGKRRP